MPERPFHVLFLCTHNAARSILAEALFNHEAARRGIPARAFSAGSRPRGTVHPLALAVLAEAGIPAADAASKGWEGFAAPDAPAIDLVVTVCAAAAAEPCPLFRGRDGLAPPHRAWPLPDPSAGGAEAFRATLAALRPRVEALLAELASAALP